MEETFRIQNKLKKPFILIFKEKIKDQDLRKLIKYLIDYGLHYEIYDETNLVLGMNKARLYESRIKYRRTIQNMNAGSIVIMLAQPKTDILKAFYAIMSNVRYLPIGENPFHYVVFNSNLWYNDPSEIFRNENADMSSGNAESQWSVLTRETAVRLIKSELTTDSKIVVVGMSIDHVGLYTTRGLIPRIVDKAHNRLDLQTMKRGINSTNPTLDSIGSFYNGTDKLIQIMSFILNKAYNMNIKTLVLIGSYPSKDIPESWDISLFIRYGIRIVRIDPREDRDSAYKVKYDWQSKDIGQNMFYNDRRTMIYDDSYLMEDYQQQMDIKYTHLEGFKGPVLMKVKEGWTKRSMLPLDVKQIFTPFVKKEFRIWSESGVYDVKPRQAVLNEMFFKQKKFNSYDIGLQKDIMGEAFTVEEKDIIRVLDEGLLIDATFSLNGLDITKDPRFRIGIEERNWKVVTTMTFQKNDKSKQYKDIIYEPDADMQFKAREMFVVPNTTQLRLSEKNVKYDFSTSNYAQCVYLATNIWNEEILWAYSQPYQAKMEQMWDRYDGVSFNSFMARNQAAVEVSGGVLMMAEDGELVSKARENIELVEISSSINVEKGEKIQVSGHLISILNSWVRFGTPLTVKAWMKLMDHYYKRPRYHAYILSRQRDMEGDVNKIGIPFHNEKDVKVTLSVFLHIWRDYQVDQYVKFKYVAQDVLSYYIALSARKDVSGKTIQVQEFSF